MIFFRGVSKASRGINLSEDIFAGFNTTLRGGNVVFKEYMEGSTLVNLKESWSSFDAEHYIIMSESVGKGRDVGLQQLTTFEAKLSQG